MYSNITNTYAFFVLDVVISPTIPEIVATEGGGRDQRSPDDPVTGGGGSGQPESGSGTNIVRGCIELLTGNLQRNLTLRVMTLPAPYSPGGVI